MAYTLSSNIVVIFSVFSAVVFGISGFEMGERKEGGGTMKVKSQNENRVDSWTTSQ